MESQLAFDEVQSDENLSYTDRKSDIPIALHSHLESRESFDKNLKWQAIEKIADLDVHTHNKAQKFPTVKSISRKVQYYKIQMNLSVRYD